MLTNLCDTLGHSFSYIMYFNNHFTSSFNCLIINQVTPLYKFLSYDAILSMNGLAYAPLVFQSSFFINASLTFHV